MEYKPRVERNGAVVVISKDHFLRDGLSSLLDHEASLTVVAKTEELSEAISAAIKGNGNALIIDMDGLSEPDRALLPGVRAIGTLKLIFIYSEATAPGEQDTWIPRSSSTPHFLKVIREALSSLKGSVVREPRSAYGVQLTQREYDVAKLVAKGYPNRSIASKLELQEQSVKNLVSVIMRKLQCENRVQVALRLSGTSQAQENSV